MRDTADFIKALCAAAGDEETMGRVKTADYSSYKLKAGDHVTGWPTLAQLTNDLVVEAVCKWLKIFRRENGRQIPYVLRSATVRAGQVDDLLLTPTRWFAKRFPSLSNEFGDAVLEETEKSGLISAQDINEDFLAATLGEKVTPEAPTVFIPEESKFYAYDPGEGVFRHQRDASLVAQFSRLLFDCARECKEECDTRRLEFRLRDSSNLSGVLRKARGLLQVTEDFFSSDLTEFLPCANGMLRLSDKALLPFSPSYRRRNKLAVPFVAATETGKV